MTTARTHRSSRRRPTTAVAVGAIVAVALAAWAVQGRDNHQEHVDTGDDPGVSHVHGLGVDPADGTLYAATHYGLFRVPETGPATRVADRFHDIMGFTVTGPHRFLASGHPDLRDEELFQEGRDPHLGLIESTDAGQTWTPLSLLGEADFHALAAAHGLIYGYNATGGEFMVTPDGRRWERRSTITLLSFAVDPDDADHLLATTRAGMVNSTDGGRSWQPLPAPALAYLSWQANGGLWGVGPDGGVYRSADRGVTWQRQGGLAGPPEAFLVDGAVLYAAVFREGIFRSTDGGRTWELRYRDP